MVAMVKVLVGHHEVEKFSGFWAEFEGEKVDSYEDKRGDKNIVYTLYRCTAYRSEAYRVHIADESDPGAPVYKLLPDENPHDRVPRKQYWEPWDIEAIAKEYPLFLKNMEYFRTTHIDP